MSLSQVIAMAPATTANFGPGFDVFGLALEQPKDKVTLTAIPKDTSVESVGTTAKSTASLVANYIKKEFNLRTNIQIRIERGITPGVGLGSSAASAAAVACGLNYMFKLNLSNNDLVTFAAKGEKASAGFEHADNVSAAIYGGFVIVRSYDPLEIINMKAPENMGVCIAYPHIATSAHKTEKARSIIPKKVPIENVVHNIGCASAMASGFATSDIELIGASMSDAVVEPERAKLIPGYQKVKDQALKAGASGVAISGAGPAMLAIVDSKKVNALRVMKAMKKTFESLGLEANGFVTTPGIGTYVLEMDK